MTSDKHNGTAYTVRKTESGQFVAAYRTASGCVVSVTHKLRRVAVACIKSHIDDEQGD